MTFILIHLYLYNTYLYIYVYHIFIYILNETHFFKIKNNGFIDTYFLTTMYKSTNYKFVVVFLYYKTSTKTYKE